jgi:hypothetical protein
MTMENSQADTIATPKQIVIASLASLSIAGALLLTTILPAEFNIDPLGTGKLLGIAGMSEAQTVGALNLQDQKIHRDRYQILLAPFESVEYKYRLEEGATMLFDWKANGELEYDMHSEQDGVDPQEYSPSFAKGVSSGAAGSFTAPFSGIHGWFWENRTSSDVLLELDSNGFFSTATEFRQGFEYKREFSEQKTPPEG